MNNERQPLCNEPAIKKQYFIIGGAGFIGNHLTRLLLKEETEANVIIFDNFSSGRLWHLDDIKDNSRLEIIKEDLKNGDALIAAMKGSDVVYHFASNPDIAKAATQPDVDFWEGTFLTNQVVEAMRINQVQRLLYASGSGVYGDTGTREVDECYSPMTPISTYGASKLACEALICSYCHMFDLSAAAFRFANVVGPHQTHGVGYDFIRRLQKNTAELSVLGDGSQTKSYIYVSDVLAAMRLIEKQHLSGFSAYNVSTLDALSVNQIADMAMETLGLHSVKRLYSGGNRGWKGDVPMVRLNSNKIRQLGWAHGHSSHEAMWLALQSIKTDVVQHSIP